MASGNVAPSRARLQAARRAGFRARSAWLPRAGAALGLFVAVVVLGPSAARMWGEAFVAGMRTGSLGGVLAVLVVGGAVVGASMLGGAVFALVLSGRFGARVRSRSLPDAPGLEHTRAGSAFVWGLGLLAGLGVLFILEPVMAGAARAVAASEIGLSELWATWLVRGLMTCAMVVAVVGVVERVAAGRRLWSALHLDARRHRELAERR